MALALTLSIAGHGGAAVEGISRRRDDARAGGERGGRPADAPRPTAEAKKQQPRNQQPRNQQKKRKRKQTIEDLIRIEFGKRADEALRIARCESKFDPHARSYSGATGVFQIMPVHRWRIRRVGGKDLTDPRTNVRVARALFKDEGWRPWTCARLLGIRA